MKQLVIYIGILMALVALPGGGTDAAELRPAELIAVDRWETGVRIRTDMGDVGTGETVTEALKAMERESTGKVLLQTARYLVVEEGLNFVPSQMQEYVRSSCKVCLSTGVEDLLEWVFYLRAHPPTIGILDAATGEMPDVIRIQGG